MIKLEDFVSQTLKEIINGVATAQEYAATNGAHIYPRESGGITRRLQKVQFDVAITATEGAKTKGGVGVFVGALGLGTHGESGSEKSSISRIAFEVPLLLPEQKG